VGSRPSLHRAHGVDVRVRTTVDELCGSGGRVTSVLVDGDTELPADLVVGIGAMPNVCLAEAAGLDVANGVVADAALHTSAPEVYAAGDVASSFHPRYHRTSASDTGPTHCTADPLRPARCSGRR
jgi:3-phenylpropionate/trans-cinnamate dioxygenase ferredoxin reductase subunit